MNQKDLVYVWDDWDQCCYVTRRVWCNNSFVKILGPVTDEGPKQHPVNDHGIGTQADLESMLRSQPWWNPLWTFPTLVPDPIPF